MVFIHYERVGEKKNEIHARCNPCFRFFYIRYPTEFWGNQQKWDSATRAEIEGAIPLKYYRMDTDTSIIDEPFADRVAFWENILNSPDDEPK